MENQVVFIMGKAFGFDWCWLFAGLALDDFA